jgi:hypothetical protein
MSSESNIQVLKDYFERMREEQDRGYWRRLAEQLDSQGSPSTPSPQTPLSTTTESFAMIKLKYKTVAYVKGQPTKLETLPTGGSVAKAADYAAAFNAGTRTWASYNRWPVGTVPNTDGYGVVSASAEPEFNEYGEVAP